MAFRHPICCGITTRHNEDFAALITAEEPRTNYQPAATARSACSLPTSELRSLSFRAATSDGAAGVLVKPPFNGKPLMTSTLGALFCSFLIGTR
jgi:hypothetical protein